MVVSSFARVAIWATPALAPATSVVAQAGTPTSIMLVDWERQKKNGLAYVDDMPTRR